MDGVLNVFKVSGPTSHDVVARIRRIASQKRVGHTGTLDPMAEGVMLICLGRATRLAQFLSRAAKQYRATVVLGASTDTQDATGRIIEECDASSVTAEQFAEVSLEFVGEIDQVPPMASAVKHGGKRLYEIARRGETVERKARRVTVHSLGVVGFEPGLRAKADIVVECSSGTYIRALCADIGRKLGCGAYMGSLTRTRVGSFYIKDSTDVDHLAELAANGQLKERVISMNDAIADIPFTALTETDAAAAAHGIEVPCRTCSDDGDMVRLVGEDGALIGIGVVVFRGDGKIVKPRIVLVDPRADA